MYIFLFIRVLHHSKEYYFNRKGKAQFYAFYKYKIINENNAKFVIRAEQTASMNLSFGADEMDNRHQ